jgi:hypothetical protein
MKRVSMETDYKVATDSVTLSIIVGDAQIGSSLVLRDGVELGRGEINGLTIGKGPEINGKTLSIKSVVTDVNDATNQTSVTYALSGGIVEQRLSQTATVDDEGDSVIYRATIHLVT